jgi:tellurite resistance protein TehA-like permease
LEDELNPDETFVILRPNFLRCYAMFVFPLVIYAVASLVMLPFGGKLSFTLLLHPHVNPIRSIIKYINASVFLYFWFFVVIPMSLKTLKHREGVIKIENGNLICFGEVACSLKSIKCVDTFAKFMNLGVTIRFDGGSFDCTQLNLCNKKPGAIKRELEHLAGIRQDDERPDGERGDL